jgi:hypothetical protein
MLVKLYDLPSSTSLKSRLSVQGVSVRRAMAYEKRAVVAWVEAHYGEGWACECDVSFSNRPISCYLAVEHDSIVGFGCYDTTCRNYFGPTGVAEGARGRGIGAVLLLSCLEAMRANGFAYAIIGGVGPREFYASVAGAVEIPGSTPGIYPGALDDSDV